MKHNNELTNIPVMQVHVCASIAITLKVTLRAQGKGTLFKIERPGYEKSVQKCKAYKNIDIISHDVSSFDKLESGLLGITHIEHEGEDAENGHERNQEDDVQ